LSGQIFQVKKHLARGSRKYNEGDVESLHAAFKGYSENLNVLNQQSLNAHNMTEDLFDREKTYAALAAFILGNDSPATQ